MSLILLNSDFEVEKTLEYSWNMYADVEKTLEYSWSIYEYVEKTLEYSWSISAWVEKVLSYGWETSKWIENILGYSLDFFGETSDVIKFRFYAKKIKNIFYSIIRRDTL